MDTTRDTQGWAAEFKDRWSEADALGMHGHRVEHALEPLLLVLSAERDRADRAEARLAESWYDGFDAGSRPPHQKTRQNPHVKPEATA